MHQSHLDLLVHFVESSLMGDFFILQLFILMLKQAHNAKRIKLQCCSCIFDKSGHVGNFAKLTVLKKRQDSMRIKLRKRSIILLRLIN